MDDRMTPTFCTVKDDPANGQYGDCVRACVAAILDMPSETVPHFFHDNCDGETAFERIGDFLRPLGYAPFFINFPGSFEEIVYSMKMLNPDALYMLFGRTENGDHVMVYKGDTMVNDPSWLRLPLIGPGEHGLWSVMVIAKS